MSDDLPEKWYAVTESRFHAEYARGDSTVVVEITPRREGYRRTGPTDPSGFLVKFYRDFGAPRATPVVTRRAADFDAARGVAVQQMADYNDRVDGYAARERSLTRRDDSALDEAALIRGEAFVAAAVDQEGYSDDLLLDLLAKRFGDAVRAVVHRSPDGTLDRVVDRTGDGDDRFHAVFEWALGGFDGADGRTPDCVVAERDDERLVVVSVANGATLVALDVDVRFVLPVFANELRHLAGDR